MTDHDYKITLYSGGMPVAVYHTGSYRRVDSVYSFEDASQRQTVELSGTVTIEKDERSVAK
jgi:hypothetical protein